MVQDEMTQGYITQSQNTIRKNSAGSTKYPYDKKAKEEKITIRKNIVGLKSTK